MTAPARLDSDSPMSAGSEGWPLLPNDEKFDDFELAECGQRPDLQYQREYLRGDDHDRGNPKRGLRIHPDVGDGAVVDVGQRERAQRDDAGLEGLGGCCWIAGRR